jgi:hypothetical protein
MDADVTPIKDALVGIWLFDAAGMQAQVSLAPDGTYTDTLVNGAQGHSGTWTVSNNGSGGYLIVLTLKDWFPKEFVGPLASTTIIMPKTETWYVTNIQPDQILVQGGILRRIKANMPIPGPSPGGMPGGAVFPGMMTTDAYNAEIAKELKQIGEAGRKVAGFFGGLFKKR